jgi:hypothetical protein
MTSDEARSRRLRRFLLGEPYLSEFRALGERRRAALVEAESVLRRVEELLPDAVQAGCSITEIADLSAVSRPTLYKLLPAAQHSK